MGRILGISGSLRGGSYNSARPRAAGELLDDGVELEIGSIRGIALYDGDIEATQGMPRVRAPFPGHGAPPARAVHCTTSYSTSMTQSPDRPTTRLAGPVPGASHAALHPRNRHRGRYDFARLTRACPELSAFVVTTAAGDASIDFSNADAVRALNRALLKADYGIAHWDIPDGYLCPPVPGRADYVHGLADLLASSNAGVIPRGAGIRALDIGVGANCIYPLLGQRDYGWRFVGSEVDATALAAASAVVQANPGLGDAIELRHQPARGHILAGLLGRDERFDVSMCNPPFHACAEDAARGSRRKWRNLGHVDAGHADARRKAPALNFGGLAGELWCTGGEASFLRRMIRESVGIQTQVFWFSSLVAKAEHLADIHRQLRKAGARDVRVAAMAHGNKRSRFVAWTFLDASQREAWRAARWSA